MQGDDIPVPKLRFPDSGLQQQRLLVLGSHWTQHSINLALRLDPCR